MNGAPVLRAAVAAVLWVAVVMSALALVSARHETRKLFAELQQLQAERDRLDIDWGRLQIEQSTWATHGRVEQVAREELDMRLPPPAEIRMVQP